MIESVGVWLEFRIIRAVTTASLTLGRLCNTYKCCNTYNCNLWIYSRGIHGATHAGVATGQSMVIDSIVSNYTICSFYAIKQTEHGQLWMLFNQWFTTQWCKLWRGYTRALPPVLVHVYGLTGGLLPVHQILQIHTWNGLSWFSRLVRLWARNRSVVWRSQTEFWSINLVIDVKTWDQLRVSVSSRQLNVTCRPTQHGNVGGGASKLTRSRSFVLHDFCRWRNEHFRQIMFRSGMSDFWLVNSGSISRDGGAQIVSTQTST